MGKVLHKETVYNHQGTIEERIHYIAFDVDKVERFHIHLVFVQHRELLHYSDDLLWFCNNHYG